MSATVVAVPGAVMWRPRPSEGGVRLQTPVAIIAALMMIGALLVPAVRSVVVNRTANTPVGNVTPEVSSVEAALADQIQQLGAGLTLAGQSDLPARFMIAGPVFGDGNAAFSVATSQYLGADLDPAVPLVVGDRMVYQRAGISEWWQRSGDGYEQGWTVTAAPADGSTNLSLLVGFANAAPLAHSDSSARLILSDGGTAWYRDLHAFDADGTVLPASMSVEGAHVRIDVDAMGAAYPVTIDPIITADQKIVPPASGTGDRFGQTIATDGNRVAVAAVGADSAGGFDAGTVSVYEYDTGSWNLLATFTDPNPGVPTNLYGFDVDLSGGTLVVGSPNDGGGAVHIYEEVESPPASGTFVFQFQQTIVEPAAGGDFGFAVAVNPLNHIAVGAPASGTAGKAYIFDDTGVGGTWEAQPGLSADASLLGYSAGAAFGAALDINNDGTGLLVGAPNETVGANAGSGQVQVFLSDGLSLTAGDIDNGPSANTNQYFGSAVVLERDSIGKEIGVVGRPWAKRGDTSAGAGGIAGVRVFLVDPNNATVGSQLTTVAIGDITSPGVNGDGFGLSVAFANDTVVVGAPFDRSTGGQPRAFVEAYTYDPNLIKMVGVTSAVPLAAPSDFPTGIEEDDKYGYSVGYATGPNLIVVGSPGHNQPENDREGIAAGQVASYTPGGPTTTFRDGMDSAAFDLMGFAVDVDGDLMAVSAIGDDEGASQSGVVYMYERTGPGANWTLDQVIADPSPGDAARPFGYSLDLNGDFLAVGSPGGVGQVDVYQYVDNEVSFDWELRASVTGASEPNTVGQLQFGWDVAIDSTGEHLFVGSPGNESFCDNCGGVINYQWVGTSYIDQSITGNNSSPGIAAFGQSIDLDEINGTDLLRLVVGITSDDRKIETWTLDKTDPPPFLLSPEHNIDSVYAIGESVAVDGNRLVGAAASGVNDAIVVVDIDQSSGDVQQRLIFEGNLASDPQTQPTGFVDVAGDIVVVGRADGAGGEIGVFFNDPTYGWGLSDVNDGWADGPVDRIQPSGRAAFDKIGRAVAVDTHTATSGVGQDGVVFGNYFSTVVAGAPGDDTAGDEAGAAYSTEVTTGWAVYPNKEVPSTFGSGQFGSDISVDGGFAAITAPGADKIYILEKQPAVNQWSIIQTIDAASNDVALQGDALASVTDSQVVLYTRSGPGLDFAQVDSTGFSTPGLGSAIAMDGATVVVGKAGALDTPVEQYSIIANVLTLALLGNPGDNDPTDYDPADDVGTDIAIDGNTVLVGAPFWDSTGADENDGKVYIWDAGDKAFADEITSPTAGDSGQFGRSVDVDGIRYIIGEPLAFGPTFGNGPDADTGLAHIYELQDPGVVFVQTLAAVGEVSNDHSDTGDQFGFSVAIDGDNAVVGAFVAEELNVPFRDGSAYGFGFNGTSWVETTVFRAEDGAADDLFGSAVAVEDLNVLVGAPNDDNAQGIDAGATYGFTANIAPDPEDPTLSFSLGLGGGTGTVVVAPDGIAVADFDQTVVQSVAENDTSLAAAPLASTNLEGTPLASLTLADTPLASLAADSDSILSGLPLIEISLEGGWQAILAGSTLDGVPLTNLTLGDVATEGGVASTALNGVPLASLTVNGTPLASLPLASLVLADVPLASLPLASLGLDWCVLLAPYFPTCAEINNLNLLEATLSGAPLASLPLASLPLASLTAGDIASLPLASLTLGETNIADSPLASLPLASLDLESLGLDSIPLASLPLASLPLASLELNDGPVSTPLASLEISGLPLASLELQGAPLASLPLASLVMADLPLASLPLASLDPNLDWCTFLANLDAGYDCSFGVDDATFLANTTIADLGVNGVPLASLPLASLDLDSLPLASLPLASLSLAGLPLASLPLASLPLASLDLTGTPLASLGGNLASAPLASLRIEGSPLASLPLASLTVAGTPLASLSLSELPLASLPLASTPLASLTVNGSPLASLPLASLDVGSTPLASLPLASLDLASAPLASLDCSAVDCDIDTLQDAILEGAIDTDAVTLADIQYALIGIHLGDIADALLIGDRAAVEAAVANLTETLSDIDLTDLTLGDLPEDVTEFETTLIGQINSILWAARFSDLVGALIDPTTGQPYPNGDVEAVLNSFIGGFTFGEVDHVGDATLGDLLQNGSGTFTFSDLGSILGLIRLNSFTDIDGLALDLGDLDADQIGDLTLLDLLDVGPPVGPLQDVDTLTLGELLTFASAADELYGFSVTDLLLALLGIDATPFSGLEFTEVETGDLPADVVPEVSFEAEFRVEGTTQNKNVEVQVFLPATASYVEGSGDVFDDGEFTYPNSEPIVGENSLTWVLEGVPDNLNTYVRFDVKPTVTLGSTQLNSVARIVGSDVSSTAFTAVQVVEGLENNDFPPPNVTVASEDTVYLTYISTPTDNDVFSITVGDDAELAIQLSSLTADLDFAVYGGASPGGVALSGVSGQAPLEPITDPDQTGANTEPLNDFRRLDQEDSTLEFIGLSNSPGTETELLLTEPLSAGTYYVQVFGANGATNVDPAALQIQVLAGETRPTCSAQGETVTGPFGSPVDLTTSTANTLILVNEQRMEYFYPGEFAALDAELTNLVSYLNANPQLGIDPIVVPVETFGLVQSAYETWDEDTNCSPETANAVVSAINNQIVDVLRPNLEHIVVIGGDQIIPMARLLDVTEVANEYDFRHDLMGNNIVGPNADDINALSATFWDRQYLSDEPYGESAARDLGNRFLYVSDIALGRMVETPDEIEAALLHFQTFNGSLQANTAAILGYDFLVDSSEQIAADLVAAGGVTVDDELADGLDAGDEAWDKDDAARKLIPTVGDAADLISLNGHFDHYRALPAIGDQVPNFTDNFLADTVANAPSGLLTGRILFSMGCHGGFNVSDNQIGAGGVNLNGDWAQTFAADQAIFIGNTGFGYGDTEAVAYTERLMALFSERAVRPIQITPGQTTTIGQALTFAKNEYASDLSVFSVYDEKALMEATFYGLPFYRVGSTPVAAAPVPTNTTNLDTVGLASLALNATTVHVADNDLNDRGVIYSDPADPDQLIVAPGMPIQPSQAIDVSVVDPDVDTTELSEVAHGAIVLGMESTYFPGIDPVVSTAVFDESSSQPEPELGNVVFPAKPLTVNTSTTPEGQRQTLVLATGQFDSSTSTQRLDDDLDVVVYYSSPGDTDFTAPTIGQVESGLEADIFTVSLSATDDIAGNVARVYVLFAEDPGSGLVPELWRGIDLQQTPGSNEWAGSSAVAAGTTEIEFLVQAADDSGNVGYATNKARNFNDDGTVEPDPPAPDLTVTVDNSNLDANGWHTQPVAVAVDSGDLDATYSIVPGVGTTPVVNGTFTISGEGVNSFTVTRSDGQTVTGVVRIDTQQPTAAVSPPQDAAVYEEGAVPLISFTCSDPSLVSCDATADGSSIDLNDQLPDSPGSHSVSVVATDAFNNTATATASYTVVAASDPPVIVDIDVDGVALPGHPVDVMVDFTGDVGPHTVTIDWGNGSTCPGVGSCSLTEPSLGDSGMVDASYTYPTGGSYDLTVTITNANGQSASATVTTATCTITGTNGGNTLFGTSGDDVICGKGGNDWIYGRGGNDLIFGGNGADRIYGDGGDDVIYGGRGADKIWGGSGTNLLIGGKGSDTIVGGSAVDTVRGRQGNDWIYGYGGNDLLIGNRGVDRIFGGNGDDTIEGRRDRDLMYGQGGHDTIIGFTGNDFALGGGGNDTIDMGDGFDWAAGQGGNDTMFGGAQDDFLRGDSGNDVIDGGDGTDTCRGNGGTDTITFCEP